MIFKTKLRYILLSLALFAGQRVIASDGYCEITQIKNDTVSERSRQIMFPNDRKLIIIGHDHGHKDFPLHLSKLSKNDRILNNEFVDQINRLVNSSTASIRHANQDIQFLQKNLENNSQIKFVAVEGTQTTTDSNFQYFFDLQNRFYNQISRRKLPPSANYRWAMLVAFGATNYLKIIEPSLFRNRKLVGVESNDASEKYKIALDKFDTARDQLKQLAKDDVVFLKLLSETYNELMVLYGFYDPQQHDAILLREVEKKIPDKYKKAGMIWFQAGLEEMKAMKERDKAVVENMISRNQSGILFIGLWHLDSVANLIKQHCIQESNTPVYRSEATLRRETTHQNAIR